MTVNTSESHPIRIDFRPVEPALGPGRLGMTFAPEVPGRGRYPQHIDTETQAAITVIGDTILARMDHYFKLQQAQYVEVRGGIADLPERVNASRNGSRARALGRATARLRDARDRVDPVPAA